MRAISRINEDQLELSQLELQNLLGEEVPFHLTPLEVLNACYTPEEIREELPDPEPAFGSIGLADNIQFTIEQLSNRRAEDDGADST